MDRKLRWMGCSLLKPLIMRVFKGDCMGRNRRKFAIGFKQQVVDEVESGLMTKYEAARKYEISASVIDRWTLKAQAGALIEKPTSEEKALRAENEKLKAKVGELTMLIDVLKKMEAFGRERRKETLSVVTRQNLAQLQGGAK
ncbi:MAG TPA: transposase [Bdellovibrionota bacterium]|nr:transposase [Bdellovibrionota bacterium]